LALYKGLTAVYAGSILKFSVRFVSFEQYRDWLRALTNHNPQHTTAVTFTAGLASGLTEAILVVTPSEVCKIRMQSQYHSLMDASQLAHRKYRNVVQTATLVVREEGLSALYKGLIPTMLRQGLNQAVNFTAYNAAKNWLLNWQNTRELAPWQALVLGGVSGGMGPLVNNPLDVVKTRLQKQVVVPGKPAKYTGLVQACGLIAKEEGVLALWKGITPRLLRIMPGQAITFMTYEAVSKQLSQHVFRSS
jgi:solute carrier family 25 (mitochondrial citrate transporter), member 1